MKSNFAIFKKYFDDGEIASLAIHDFIEENFERIMGDKSELKILLELGDQY